MTVDTRNVHERKLAVMAKCDVIKPDAQYDAPTKAGGRMQFPYNSIQAISNHIRKFCVEERLDVTCSGGDVITVELVNVDDPKDTILAHWPMVPDDKAWAYSTKFALIRTFLIGDGTEGDEAENAARSGKPVETPARSRGADARPKIKVVSREALGRVCPEDGGDLELVTWDNGQSRVTCSNWKTEDGGCKYREAPEAAHPEGEGFHDPEAIPF